MKIKPALKAFYVLGTPMSGTLDEINERDEFLTRHGVNFRIARGRYEGQPEHVAIVTEDAERNRHNLIMDYLRTFGDECVLFVNEDRQAFLIGLAVGMSSYNIKSIGQWRAVGDSRTTTVLPPNCTVHDHIIYVAGDQS